MSNFDVHITNFAGQLRQWGALPEDAAAAVATFAAARTATSSVGITALDDLRSAALRGDIDAESVGPALYDAAAAMLADEKARTLAADLDAPLSQRFASSIVNDGAWILDRLRVHWDTAATSIAEGVLVIPAETTSDDVLNYGTAEMRDAWQRVGVSGQVLDLIAELRRTLRNRYSWDHDGPSVAMFLADADDRIDTADRIYRGGRDSGVVLSTPLEPVRGGVWARLIHAGFALRLNSPSEAQAIAATANTSGYFRPQPLGAA